MLKNRVYNFSADTDVNAVECKVHCARLKLVQSASGEPAVECPPTKNIVVELIGNRLVLTQGKRSIFYRAPQEITVSVPTHTVPSVTVGGKSCDCAVENGLFGEINFSADEGALSLNGCVADNLSVTGGAVNVYIGGATVKAVMRIQTDRGELLAENTFATHTECRVKRGNLGLVKFSCKDCLLDTSKGNISASIAGCAQNYTTSLTAKEGTVNRENAKSESSDGFFQAYTGKGNIVLEFDRETEQTPEEELVQSITESIENNELTRPVAEEEKET